MVSWISVRLSRWKTDEAAIHKNISPVFSTRRSFKIRRVSLSIRDQANRWPSIRIIIFGPCNLVHFNFSNCNLQFARPHWTTEGMFLKRWTREKKKTVETKLLNLMNFWNSLSITARGSLDEKLSCKFTLKDPLRSHDD